MAAKNRVQYMTGLMESLGLDVYIGVTSAFHNFLDADPVVSLAGFRPLGPCAVLVDRSGQVVLLVSPPWDAERARDQCPAARVVACDDLAKALEREVQQIGVADRKVGLSVMEAAPAVLHRQVKSLFAADVIDASRLLRQAAAIKTADELADARRATSIAEQGYRHMLELVKPGMAEFELAAEMLCFMKSMGSHDNFLLMSGGQHNNAVRAPSRRIIERGDIMLAEITPSVNNQFSQICRTVVLGPPTELLRSRFAILQEAMAVGKAAAVPGASVSMVARAMNSSISAAGFSEYCRPPYMRVRGHGLGNISSEPGDIDEDNKRILEQGMIFVMHPNQYFPDVGYLLCGEPVVINDNGAVALSASEAQLDHIDAGQTAEASAEEIQ
jgi:Xaa-Pro dipeptidase